MPENSDSTVFDGISAAASGIVAASHAGFTISENGARPMLAAIEDLADEVASALGQSNAMEREPSLGSTPNATIYKPFLATVASDPAQGAVPALRKLHVELMNAHAAIRKAMQNYHTVEDANVSAVTEFGSWV
ncbi:MAG TPA: hypothetical protein VHV74_14670 [Pseudonocardiaceae bacterium]|jgi:hypothetical protein|nr:hypothetical protein [Pseudonocardiaceae bacterium]